MRLSALIRSWPTLAAWGAGLLQIGLGAGAITLPSGAQDAGVATRGTGVLLVAVGAAALVWGVVALAKDSVVAPRAGMAISLGGIIAATAALAVDPSRISTFAVGVSVLLLLVVGVASALTLRRMARRRAAETREEDSPVIVGASASAPAPDRDGAAPRRSSSVARAASASSTERTQPRTSMLGLIVGCVIVAGLVTPALGSTTVGGMVPDHSGHDLVVPGHDSGH